MDLFIARDAHDDLTVWRPNPGAPDQPIAELRRSSAPNSIWEIVTAHIANAASTVGADPTPVDPACWPTPGQWVARFLGDDGAGRRKMAERALECAQRAHDCTMQGHASLLDELADLKFERDALAAYINIDAHEFEPDPDDEESCWRQGPTFRCQAARGWRPIVTRPVVSLAKPCVHAEIIDITQLGQRVREGMCRDCGARVEVGGAWVPVVDGHAPGCHEVNSDALCSPFDTRPKPPCRGCGVSR